MLHVNQPFLFLITPSAGELLQPGGVEKLRAMGLGDCLEGLDAVPVSLILQRAVVF